MTIGKAIEVLERTVTREPSYGNPIIVEATRLGVEALKFGKDYFGPTNFLYLLKHQDETKED